jgi:hypothetical protein
MPLNRLHWYVRWPCKWAAFAIVYFIVCFPYPSLFIRHVRHWSNPNALIEPDAPALQPWVQELRTMPAESDPRAVLKRVQQFVYNHVPYDWDWNTWGLVDYMPTVTEVVEQGREDCDGRAVIAASLLRNLGYNARLVTDFAHVWVATDYGETMGPGKTKTVEVTDKGMKFQWGGLVELPRATAYGVAVFPPERELILVAAAWVLLLGGAGYARSAAALLLLVGGLFLMRHGGHDYRKPLLWAELAGLASLVVAFVLMFLRTRHRGSGVAITENVDPGGR